MIGQIYDINKCFRFRLVIGLGLSNPALREVGSASSAINNY